MNLAVHHPTAWQLAHNLASPASGKTRSLKIGSIADLAYVLDLQKHWSQNVGFLPRAAFKRYLKKGQIILVNEGGLNAGYLIWTFRPDGLVRLPQVAISPELLRSTLGTRMMRSLIRSALKNNCSVIRLCSRSDLPANKFWPDFGFKPTAVTARPSTRGLPIIEHTLQLIDSAQIAHVLSTNGRPYRIGKRPPPAAPSELM